MKVIPVLDLMRGLVVQAVKGERNTYRPVLSEIVNSAQPLDVARALLTVTRSDSVYLADLDAIRGGEGQGEIIADLARRLPASLWVDAGAATLGAAREILRSGVSRAVLCTENLKSLGDLEEAARLLEPARLIVSLDMKGGKILTAGKDLLGQDPMAALSRLADLGFDDFILMTLDQVGTGAGPAWGILEQARSLLPQAFLVAAGGVNSLDDVSRLAHMGLDAVLVATSLHRRWITGEELTASGFTTSP